MAKTNWQDPQTSEIRSTHISGLMDAVGKLEESIGMDTVAEENIPLTEVYISAEDRYRIFQAPAGKRNWLASPAPVIKKNGVVIESDYVIDYGGGAIALSVNDTEENTYTADVTYVTPLNVSFKSHLADMAKVGLDFSGDTGNARGTNAVDLQHVRLSEDPAQVAGADMSFIAGGQRNKIQNIIERDADAYCSFATGMSNRAHEWFAHVSGANCIADGKISTASGNGCICSANDSLAEGNRTVTGRKLFMNITTGSEDAGDGLGVLQYVLIPDIEGDVSSYFPNALTDDVTTRYGAGAQIDVKGNIYPSGMTPAIWADDIPTIPNDLRWALHPYCILGGSGEGTYEFARIAKATYSIGVGTKVYYYGDKPFSTLAYIYSSYAPTVIIRGTSGDIKGGNGEHSEGVLSSAFGYGTHAEGYMTRAWNHSAHAQGRGTQALAPYSDANGYLTEARGVCSSSVGQESKATRDFQHAYAVGKITNKGDCQKTEIDYKHGPLVGTGWWMIYILKGCEIGKAYNFETMVMGRQTAGIAETIGNTFAYKFTGCFVRNADGTYTVLGTPTRTLIGRSAGMSGDGLTTGIRVAWSTLFTSDNAHLRMDGLADTTYFVLTHNVIQEMGL